MKISFLICNLFFFSFFISSCLEYKNPNISDREEFPSSSIDYTMNGVTHLLVLNSNTIHKYKSGSIQDYIVSENKHDFSLAHSYELDSSASDLAMTEIELNGSFFIAVSYATIDSNNAKDNRIDIFKFSPESEKLELFTSYQINDVARIQVVRDLRIEILPEQNTQKFLVYGTVVSSKGQNRSDPDVPSRVFGFAVNSKNSEISDSFYLSYGISDPNSFVDKSDSLLNNPIGSYSFGSTAPSIYKKNETDGVHQFLIAFPTGTRGGMNYGQYNTYPGNSNFTSDGQMKQYFGGMLDADGNYILNPSSTCADKDAPASSCPKIDIRSYSVMIVDLNHYFTSKKLNLNTYFVPFSLNKNGVPFGAKSSDGQTVIDQNLNDDNSNSLAFLTGIWASYSLKNSPNCHQSGLDKFDIVSNCENSMLFSRKTVFGFNSFSVFQMSGLNEVADDISLIAKNSSSTENDFAKIQHDFVIDPYSNYKNFSGFHAFPLVPYVIEVLDANNANAASLKESTVSQFGMNQIDGKSGVFWVRVSTHSDSVYGLDHSWIESPQAKTKNASEGNLSYSQGIFNPWGQNSYAFFEYGSEVCVPFEGSENSNTLLGCSNFVKGQNSFLGFGSETQDQFIHLFSQSIAN